MSDVLLVDDESRFCQATSALLRQQGYDVTTANSLAAARKALESRTPRLLLLDLMLPDGNGLDLLEELGGGYGGHVAIVTGHPSIKAHIQSVTGPDVSYLTKPVNRNEILRLVRVLGDDQQARRSDARMHFGLLVGESAPMRAVYKAIERFGPTETTVLVQGESGTGKELVAEALHHTSGRTGALVAVNCGALSKDLVASELFGHEKGSFTGASRRHRGFFERADGGTLFLDEITEMPLELQVHLLRALESGEIVRVGGEKQMPVNTRLIAATNQNPLKAVKDGKLREDLYYRLSEFIIEVPALRERVDDVPLLLEHFIAELNEQYRAQKHASDRALQRFSEYQWPGNVREFKHVVHRAFVLSEDDSVLEPPDFFENALGVADDEGVQPGRAIREVERELILKTLSHFGGDKKAAAETLGISLKTLYNRLNSYQGSSGSEASAGAS